MASSVVKNIQSAGHRRSALTSTERRLVESEGVVLNDRSVWVRAVNVQT